MSAVRRWVKQTTHQSCKQGRQDLDLQDSCQLESWPAVF